MVRAKTHPQNDPVYRQKLSRYGEIMKKYTGDSNPSPEEEAEYQVLADEIEKIERDYKFSPAGEVQFTLEAAESALARIDCLRSGHGLFNVPDSYLPTLKEAEQHARKITQILDSILEQL